MNRFLMAFFLAFLALSSPVLAQSRAFEVSGWIPTWRSATGTAEALAHLPLFTEVNPFSYTVKSDGTIAKTQLFDGEPWATLAITSRSQKVRFIPTVAWSDGAAIHRILSNAKTRRALADEIAMLVREKNWDGIDIDFENKRAETRPYFSLFLQGLQTRLGSKKWLMCTIEARTPVSSRYTKKIPKDATNYANDFKQIAKWCDRVRIMTYDQGTIDVKLNADALGPYMPNADIKWVEKVMKLALADIPKKKLVMGIPTYGSEYEVTPFTNGGYEYDRLWSFNPRYAVDLTASLNIPPTRNQAGELSFVYTPKSAVSSADSLDTTTGTAVSTSSATGEGSFSTTTPFRLLWWSDAQAIADKVALAKKLGIRGVAVFKIDGGADPNMWGLLP